MILFHEGLPRSGKSYEAMVRHVFAALRSGRKVFAYVEGIDHAKIAAVLELAEDRVRELLHQITREDVIKVYEVVEDNSLVVLDEAQNFWPTGRQRLGDEMTQFITEHGHRGLDILLMGQVFTDVHKLWRGRVSQKVLFHKLDAVGQENRYSVAVFKATGPERFVEISKTIEKYDPKYFGTYKSHVSDDTNTLNYKDSRADVRNAFWVRWGVPLAVGAAVWGGYVAWKYFHPDLPPAPAPIAAAAASAPKPAAPPAPKVKERKPFIEDLNDRYRPRLALLFEHAGKLTGTVEWWDGDKVRERLTFREIAITGTEVEVRGSLVRIAGTWVTAWPVERAMQMPTVGSQVVPLGSVATVGAP